jgi:hypothetical protein
MPNPKLTRSNLEWKPGLLVRWVEPLPVDFSYPTGTTKSFRFLLRFCKKCLGHAEFGTIGISIFPDFQKVLVALSSRYVVD